MSVKQALMRSCVLNLGRRETGFLTGVCEVVEGVLVDLDGGWPSHSNATTFDPRSLPLQFLLARMSARGT